MCFMSAPKAPPMPAIPKPVAPPTERDASLGALEERRRRLQGQTKVDITDGLGDPSLAPTSKTTLGG
jgi:hypothetical protein